MTAIDKLIGIAENEVGYLEKKSNKNDKYRRVVWRCNHKFDNDRKCATPHLDEKTIMKIFISAMNKLITNKRQILADFELIKSTLFSTSELEAQKAELEKELEATAEFMQNCIDENAHVAQNQTEYNKKYNALAERFDKTQSRLDEVNAQITDKNARCKTIELFMKNLKKQSGAINEFDENLWLSMVDFVTVNSKDDILVTFKNGAEIKA